MADENVIRDDSRITPELMTYVAKVPEVTLVFWIVKILCTSVGEIGADALTMSYFGETTENVDPFWHEYGYLIGAGIFLVVFLIAVGVQIFARKFHPVIYWTTIVATTLLGTALADYFTRSEGFGYYWGSAILLTLVLLSLAAWKLVTGTIDIASVRTARSEIFYWVTIMFSQTLGTALGDYVAAGEGKGLGLGYLTSGAIFGGMMVVLAILAFSTKISRTVLFWIAFILTRPLGAVTGDYLDKPLEDGGLEMNRYILTGILLALIVLAIFIFPQRPAEEQH
ncbi:MAG TPA: hypothetical protein VGO43_06445 [Pyrinomonadaceae bacterium]|jgi:uncharacterized membrane-anchored protein|nr:hypothetical protein [Pyrinomonadaceae bacterium]